MTRGSACLGKTTCRWVGSWWVVVAVGVCWGGRGHNQLVVVHVGVLTCGRQQPRQARLARVW
jgi:hypothetical protein